jgi:hypothetical protein
MNINQVTIKPATQKHKKYQAVIDYDSGKTKTVAFGAKGMSDYTLHKDPERKDRYLKRHANDPTKIDSAGFWARSLLWNKPSLVSSANDIARKKHVKVQLKL